MLRGEVAAFLFSCFCVLIDTSALSADSKILFRYRISLQGKQNHILRAIEPKTDTSNNMQMNPWILYKKLIITNPIFAKSSLSSLGFALGDLVAQLLFEPV